MNLITPDPGLLFWMVLIFAILLFVLAKWGFPAITGAVEKRTAHIKDSLAQAEDARKKMEELAAEQRALLDKTRKEQAAVIKEATDTKNRIIEQAKEEASRQTAMMLEKAKTDIAAEKESALRDIRKEVALLSIEVAGKVLRKDLSTDKSQADYIGRLVDEIAGSKPKEN